MVNPETLYVKTTNKTQRLKGQNKSNKQRLQIRKLWNYLMGLFHTGDSRGFLSSTQQGVIDAGLKAHY